MTQLSLFDWSDPRPVAHARKASRSGDFRVWHRCACGAVHEMVWLSYPVNMLALRHWRATSPCPPRGMADQWGGYAMEVAA